MPQVVEAGLLPALHHSLAAALDVRQSQVAELIPLPPITPEMHAAIVDGIANAEDHGWIEVDPETLEPTGRRVFETLPEHVEEDGAARVGHH
jgi:hypothetical protein